MQDPFVSARNRELSPVTGLTRTHWGEAADAQLRAVERYASPRRAQYRLHGRPSVSGTLSDGLEGYARTFLLAAFRVAGEDGNDPHGFLDRYREGLIAGTDPRSPEAWPPIRSRSQPLVEAASVAIGLHLTKPWLWERLDARERRQVARWLSEAGRAEAHPNNWVLFKVVVQEFLASAGFEHVQRDIDEGLARADGWYVGGGWYRDGDGDNFDHYVGWAMHLYTAMWSLMAAERMPNEAARRREICRERLREFLQDDVHLFGGNGAPLFQGRSLIYRYAATAPLWLGEMLEASPIAPGAVRRIASGTLSYFLDPRHDRGGVDGGAEHSALAEDGTLPLGWFGPFPPMVQGYSGPASPYWASKGFLGLLLPAEHPVWSSVEELAPVERRDTVRLMREPGFLLSSTADDGIARVINHGSDHFPRPEEQDDPHYSRLAYSTHTAPSYDPDMPDNTFSLMGDPAPGDAASATGPFAVPSHRTRIVRREGRMLASSTQPATRTTGAMDDTRVDSASAVHGCYELRLHRSVAAEGTVVRETGFAVPAGCPDPDPAGPDAAGLESAGVGAAGSGPVGDGRRAEHRRTEPPTHAQNENAEHEDSVQSALVPVHGYTARGIRHLTGASPLAERIAVPWLSGTQPTAAESEGSALWASLSVLARHLPPAEVLERIAADAVVEPGRSDSEAGPVPARVTVTLPDGTLLTAALR